MGITVLTKFMGGRLRPRLDKQVQGLGLAGAGRGWLRLVLLLAKKETQSKGLELFMELGSVVAQENEAKTETETPLP